MNEFFQIAIFISLFCVGLRIISSKGMVGYFLRKGYDNRSYEMQKIAKYIDSIDADMNNHNKELDKISEKWEGFVDSEDVDYRWAMSRVDLIQKHIDNQNIERARQVLKYNKLERTNTLYKPIIGCCTCMASFWTIFLFHPASIIANGHPEWILSIVLIPLMMFVVATFNSIIYSLYNHLNKKVVESKCN